MREMNREMELNMNELEQVNGGFTICVGFGFSNESVISACMSEGYALDDDDDTGYGANSCVGFGAGIGITF